MGGGGKSDLSMPGLIQPAREPHPLELHDPMAGRASNGRMHSHTLLGGSNEFSNMKPIRPR